MTVLAERERPEGGSPKVREDPLGTPPLLSLCQESLREPREGPENLGSRRSWRSKIANPGNNDYWVRDRDRQGRRDPRMRRRCSEDPLCTYGLTRCWRHAQSLFAFLRCLPQKANAAPSRTPCLYQAIYLESQNKKVVFCCVVAKHCLENLVLVAESPEHKFDVVAAAIRASENINGERPGMHVIRFRKIVRFCKIVRALESAIVWDLDLQDNTVLLDAGVARGMLREFHAEIVAQQTSQQNASNDLGSHAQASVDEYGQMLQTGTCRP